MLDNLRNNEKIGLQHTRLQNIADPIHTRWDWADDDITTTFMIKMKKIPQKATVSITIHCLK
jgi:hypothetical protein